MSESTAGRCGTRAPSGTGLYDRLRVNRNWLGFWFMVPAAA